MVFSTVTARRNTNSAKNSLFELQSVVTTDYSWGKPKSQHLENPTNSYRCVN